MKIFFSLAIAFGLLFGSIDINTANQKELTSLSGIGASKAKTIITFRKNHCFKNVSELSLVKGIGSKTIEKNRKSLTASECK